MTGTTTDALRQSFKLFVIQATLDSTSPKGRSIEGIKKPSERVGEAIHSKRIHDLPVPENIH